MPANVDLTYTGELTVVTCWCGMTHAVPIELRNYQLREHEAGRTFSVHCPLERAENALDHERASHRATKGHLTRSKRRASPGDASGIARGGSGTC